MRRGVAAAALIAALASGAAAQPAPTPQGHDAFPAMIEALRCAAFAMQARDFDGLAVEADRLARYAYSLVPDAYDFYLTSLLAEPAPNGELGGLFAFMREMGPDFVFGAAFAEAHVYARDRVNEVATTEDGPAEWGMALRVAAAGEFAARGCADVGLPPRPEPVAPEDSAP